MDLSEEPETKGWDAIDAALAKIYGDQEPKHFGTVIKFALGGPDPLDGVSVYRSEEDSRHLHYISYGFSELYGKETDDPDYSGFGFELTFRLAVEEFTEEPPTWPITVMQNLARYVFKTGNVFDENHHLPLNGKIALDEQTDLTCIMLLLDPQLGEIDTPHGLVKFIQMVGLTGDEYAFVKEGYYKAIRDHVIADTPLRITYLYRQSILTDEAVKADIEANATVSKQTESFGTHIEFEITGDFLHIKLGATRIPEFIDVLQNTLAADQPVAFYGERTGIIVHVDDSNHWATQEELLNLHLTTQTITDIANQLKPLRETHDFPSWRQLTLEVLPVEIKDRDGNVTEVVG